MADLLAEFGGLSDVDVVAITLVGEAGGRPIEDRIAVGCLIRNRVRAQLRADGRPDWWGEGFGGVCLARLQFSCWWAEGGYSNFQRVIALARDVVAGRPPSDPAIAAVWPETQWIAAGIVSGLVRDRVAGCTHYHTTAMKPGPAWARGVAPACIVGAHAFYRGIR